MLRAEERSTPSVRAYLAEVNTYKIDADLLSRDIADARSVVRHEAELRELDAGWNRTAKQLKAIPGLTRTAEQAINTAVEADRAVERALNISGAVLDRAALQRAVVGLEYAVRNLAGEIDFGAAIGSSAERNQLLTACNNAQQQARRMAGMLYDGYDVDRGRMIEEYRRFTQLTGPVIRTLRTNPDRGVNRAVRTVQELQQETSDLLLIDRTVDADELRYRVADLEADVERFFKKTNLEVLRDIPRAEEALASADAFWGVFENFRSVLNIESDPAEWAAAYGYIDQEWRDFRSIYSAVNSEQARTDLREIEAGMDALRESLSLTQRFDRDAVAELAAQIEASAYSIKRDGEQWLRQVRPPYMTAALRDLVAYEDMSRRFHEGDDPQRDPSRNSSGRPTSCSSSGRSSTATSSSATPTSGGISPARPATPPRRSAPCRTPWSADRVAVPADRSRPPRVRPRGRFRWCVLKIVAELCRTSPTRQRGTGGAARAVRLPPRPPAAPGPSLTRRVGSEITSKPDACVRLRMRTPPMPAFDPRRVPDARPRARRGGRPAGPRRGLPGERRSPAA